MPVLILRRLPHKRYLDYRLRRPARRKKLLRLLTMTFLIMTKGFLLGLLYARFRPSERTKQIRVYFRCTESALVDLCLKWFKGTVFKSKKYILYTIQSLADLQHLRSLVVKTKFAPLQCWRPFLDQFAPLPKRCKGMNRSFIARRRKARYRLTLEKTSSPSEKENSPTAINSVLPEPTLLK